jgi:hypothetical protein
MTLVTVVLPDPVPPAIPTITGAFCAGMG